MLLPELFILPLILVPFDIMLIRTGPVSGTVLTLLSVAAAVPIGFSVVFERLQCEFLWPWMFPHKPIRRLLVLAASFWTAGISAVVIQRYGNLFIRTILIIEIIVYFLWFVAEFFLLAGFDTTTLAFLSKGWKDAFRIIRAKKEYQDSADWGMDLMMFIPGLVHAFFILLMLVNIILALL